MKQIVVSSSLPPFFDQGHWEDQLSIPNSPLLYTKDRKLESLIIQECIKHKIESVEKQWKLDGLNLIKSV